MGFNMTLEFLHLDVHVDEYAPGQSLVNNEKPEDYSVPVFFHVQCSLAAPTLVNGQFINCLRTVEMNKDEEYKYLHHFVPKRVLYIPVRLATFREIHFDFTNDLNQTLMFSSDSVLLCYVFVLYYYNHAKRNSSKVSFFSHSSYEEWKSTLFDRALNVNGDWEMCLSQLYLPRSEITVFSDCKIEFRYDSYQNSHPKYKRIDCGMKN